MPDMVIDALPAEICNMPEKWPGLHKCFRIFNIEPEENMSIWRYRIDGFYMCSLLRRRIFN